ncbi:glycosyltransferase [Burkholderia plantarii]|uniref:glycosyltransferase n=1 Tax=Burkholderia plantarii TaxID=41899 RepID=UPI002729CAC8|nr:glycosyltransferase [Burkholderia plantarii]WLE60163.1 glycosyltransferase [Burkholderia plantarii]
MNITAVVVTHNRPQLLADALRALRAQTRSPDAIVVVDNASTPDTAQVLENFENVEVVRLDRNVGGAGGFAAGIEAALLRGADWILLLDDDAIAGHDIVERLRDVLNEPGARRIGALCTTVIESGDVALMHRRRFDPTTLREPVIPLTRYKDTRVPLDTASFVGFLLNADAVREIGLPNASFFLAYDDTEYSLRLNRAGWTIWLVPAATVTHLRSPAARLRHGPYGIKHYYNLRNQLAVFRHYGTAPCWRLWKPIVLHGVLAARDMRVSSLKTWLKALRDSRRMHLEMHAES